MTAANPRSFISCVACMKRKGRWLRDGRLGNRGEGPTLTTARLRLGVVLSLTWGEHGGRQKLGFDCLERT